jgi:tetratricopeptide (TPR) repeat protein
VRAGQWARTAWALALLFGSLPLASKLFLGGWSFEGAAEIACLCGALGVYLQVRAGRRLRALPDSAALLDEAIQLASSGEVDRAIAVLTQAIRLDPRLWQAYQYRGELRLRDPESVDDALQDFTEAIQLAPQEPHLYLRRSQIYLLLGDDFAGVKDRKTAEELRAEGPGGCGCG